MAFVEVVQRRSPAKRRHRPGAADTQNHLLFQSMLSIAAVEPIGDGPVGSVIRRQVGIE